MLKTAARETRNIGEKVNFSRGQRNMLPTSFDQNKTNNRQDVKFYNQGKLQPEKPVN